MFSTWRLNAASLSTVFFGGLRACPPSLASRLSWANGFYFQEREIPLETVLSIDFERHPQAYWEWFHEILPGPVEPNGAHRALASLEAAGAPGRCDHAEYRRPAPAGRVARRVGAARLRAARVHELWPSHHQAIPSELMGIPCPAPQMRPDIVMYGEALDQDVIEAAVSRHLRASTLIVAVRPRGASGSGPYQLFLREPFWCHERHSSSADAHAT